MTQMFPRVQPTVGNNCETMHQPITSTTSTTSTTTIQPFSSNTMTNILSELDQTQRFPLHQHNNTQQQSDRRFLPLADTSSTSVGNTTINPSASDSFESVNALMSNLGFQQKSSSNTEVKKTIAPAEQSFSFGIDHFNGNSSVVNQSLFAPSPTVNTKNAMSKVHSMFTDTLGPEKLECQLNDHTGNHQLLSSSDEVKGRIGPNYFFANYFALLFLARVCLFNLMDFI